MVVERAPRVLPPETASDPEDSSELTVFMVDDLPGIRQDLQTRGELTQGGTILFDSDETLRPSLSGKLPGNGHSFWQLDKLPTFSRSFLKELKAHRWQLAIVSNQPDQGHQLASLLGKLAGYTPLLQFAQENDIPFFGFNSHPFSLDNLPAVIKQSFHYYFSPLGRTLYKTTPQAVEQVGGWIKEHHRQGPLIWVGNNSRDQSFASQLTQKLSGKSLRMYRLPQFYTQEH